MKLIDLYHPFFKPIWVRVAVVVVCFGWSVLEFANGNALWGVVFAGIGAVCAYRFSVIDYAALENDGREPPQD